VLAALDPFLANLNPVIRYTNAYRANVTDWMTGPPAGLAGTLQPQPGDPSPRHTLRQVSYLSNESLSIYPERRSDNRGNGYVQPFEVTGFAAASHGIFPNFDCKPSGGEVGKPPPNNPTGPAPCFVAPKFGPEFGGGQAPQVFADP
jgi:hypothetical protein